MLFPLVVLGLKVDSTEAQLVKAIGNFEDLPFILRLLAWRISGWPIRWYEAQPERPLGRVLCRLTGFTFGLPHLLWPRTPSFSQEPSQQIPAPRLRDEVASPTGIAP